MTGLGFLELRLRGMTPRFDDDNCDKNVANGRTVNKWVRDGRCFSEGKLGYSALFQAYQQVKKIF